jgi:branched-chain amino acid transport system substrate-binding protein
MSIMCASTPKTPNRHIGRADIVISRIAILALVSLLLTASPGQAAQGVYADEVVVGTHVDLSGPLSSWGVAVRNGIEMAFEEANEAGGVNNRTLRLVTKDDGYVEELATQAVRDLVENENAFAILSPLGTQTSHAAAAVARENNFLYLFPVTGPSNTPVPQSPFHFSLAQTIQDEITTGVRRVLETRPGNVAIMAPGDEFGHAIRAGAKAQTEAMGAEIIADITIARDASDYSFALRWLRERDIDIIVVGTIGTETIGIMQAARQLRWSPTFLCASSCYTPELAALGGEIVEGLYAVGQIPIPYTGDRLLGEWARNYETNFGMVASSQALIAYRNARLFLNVLNRVGRTPTPANFRHALETLGPYTDPLIDITPIIFSAEDHSGQQDVFLAQARRGRWVIVPQISPTRL